MKLIAKFCSDYSNELISLLEKNKIKYTISEFGTYKLVVFYIDELHPDFEIIKQATSGTILYYKKFTKKEFDIANYYTIRSWYQNFDLYLKAPFYNMDLREEIDEDRARHKIFNPRDKVLITKYPKSKKQHYFSSFDFGYNFIFCDTRVRDVVSAVTDEIEFIPTHTVKEKGEIKMWYMNVKNVITQDYHSLPDNTHKYVCPICGDVTYDYGGEFIFKLFKRPPESYRYALKTESIFGIHATHPIHIISKKLYTLLKENDLLYGLVVEPIL